MKLLVDTDVFCKLSVSGLFFKAIDLLGGRPHRMWSVTGTSIHAKEGPVEDYVWSCSLR